MRLAEQKQIMEACYQMYKVLRGLDMPFDATQMDTKMPLSLIVHDKNLWEDLAHYIIQRDEIESGYLQTTKQCDSVLIEIAQYFANLSLLGSVTLIRDASTPAGEVDTRELISNLLNPEEISYHKIYNEIDSIMICKDYDLYKTLRIYSAFSKPARMETDKFECYIKAKTRIVQLPHECVIAPMERLNRWGQPKIYSLELFTKYEKDI